MIMDLEWKKKKARRIKSLDNDSLIKEILYVASISDYLNEKEAWQFGYLEHELKRRLRSYR